MSANNFMGMDGFVWFTGVVEDRDDPDKLGRVRVRCLGFHTEDKNKISTKDLPWAHVMHPVTDPSMQGMGNTPSFMVEGTWVVGFFRDAEDKQQPIIIGTLPGVPEDEPNKNLGFNDPNGTYPQKEIGTSGHALSESDINRLARNDTNQAHAIVKSKNDSRTKSIPVANSSTLEWTEKLSTYAAEYPKNHVYETESGHIKEFDDTKDAERIHEYHRSGTFYEVDAEGNKHTRIVGTNYEVIAGDNFVNVKGDVNLTIDSNCRTYINGDWDIQVNGNKNEVVKKNVTETYGTENGEHSHTISVTGKRAETVSNTVTETYQDAKTENVTGEVTETFESTFTSTITGAVSETYKANQTTNITGTLDIDADTLADITAPTVDINGSTAINLN